MKKNKLAQFIDLIPAEKNDSQRLPGAPRQLTILPTSFYTKMFIHLIKSAQFEPLQCMIEKTPDHVTNAEPLIQALKPYLEKEATSHDPYLLESLY